MSDDGWEPMSEDEVRDLVGRRVRVVWAGGACIGQPGKPSNLGLCVKDCCETVHVRVRYGRRDSVFAIEKRVTPKREEDRPAP